MMGEFQSVLSGVLNLRTLLLVLFLVVIAFFVAYVAEKNKRAQRKKPGQYLRYETPERTAAQCMDLLGHKNIYDMFVYKLEAAKAGGWYITFQMHNPTQQPLDTMFLLRFETETPARFSLTFVREAFGMREPVLPEEMLDEFLAKKLDAIRLPTPEEPAPEPNKKRRRK